MVTFSFLNLIDDSYPSPKNDTNAMDVILCRNVLMYFNTKAMKSVIDKFYNSLSEGGWLIVTPSEASSILFPQFTRITYPGTILFRKTSSKKVAGKTSKMKKTKKSSKSVYGDNFKYESKTATSADLKPGYKSPKEKVIKPVKESADLYKKALKLYRLFRYEESEQIIQKLLEKNESNIKYMVLLIMIYSNQGKLERALSLCKKAMSIDKMDTECHYLHGLILQEKKMIPEAVQALNRAIYLDSDHIFAHFALGNIAMRQGQTEFANKHFLNALPILDSYHKDDVISELDGITAGRLSEIIKSMLNGNNY